MSTRLTTPIFGLDYTNEISTAALKAAGVRFVVRYLSRYSWKVITASEKAHLEAAGIGIGLVFEDSANDAYRGYNAGVSNARFARAQAVSLGFPADTVIRFASDLSSVENGVWNTDSYFDGVASVVTHARSGGYGDYQLVERCAARGHAYNWQTYAWSGGRWSVRPQVQLYQYSNGRRVGGADVDFTQAWYADWGQAGAHPAPPPPPPVPIPIDLSQLEEDMITSVVDSHGRIHIFALVPKDKADPTKGGTILEVYQDEDAVHWVGGKEGVRKAEAYPLADVP